jgi:DNA-directed RNA polymerase subunit RPC12/RpoP
MSGWWDWARWKLKRFWWRAHWRCLECGGELTLVSISAPGGYWLKRCKKCGHPYYT